MEKKRWASTLTERERRKIAEWITQSVSIDVQLLSNASSCSLLNVEASVSHDGLILGYGSSEGTKSHHEIEAGSTSGQITMRIKRKMDNFLLFEKTNGMPFSSIKKRGRKKEVAELERKDAAVHKAPCQIICAATSRFGFSSYRQD